MSGGSFDYLCYAEARDLPSRLLSLQDMADALTRMGYADAAAETEDIIAYIQHSQRQIEARQRRLIDVWKAVEWQASGDSGQDRTEAAIAAYRSA